jgi:hypothetical protein
MAPPVAAVFETARYAAQACFRAVKSAKRFLGRPEWLYDELARVQEAARVPVSTVRPYLLRITEGPYTAAGYTRLTAHELGVRLAVRLRVAIGMNRHHPEKIRELYQRFASIDFDRYIALVELESVRAFDRSTSEMYARLTGEHDPAENWIGPFTFAEAADRLGYKGKPRSKSQRVYRRIKAGKLRAKKDDHSRKFFFDPTQLDDTDPGRTRS